MSEKNKGSPVFSMTASVDDADQLTEMLRGWNLEFHQLNRGRIDARLAHVASGPVLLTECSMTRRIQQRGASPTGYRTIAIPCSDTMQVRLWGEDHMGSNLMLFRPGREMDCISNSNFHVFTVSVAEEHLQKIARRRQTDALERFEFGSEVIACHRDTRERLRGLAARLVESATTLRTGSTQMNLRPALEENLVSELLDALDEAMPVSGRPMARTRAQLLRKALDVIESHADQPVSIAEVERRSGAGTRTLRYAFQEAFGVSPKQYLQAHRLNQVRRQLRIGRPEETTISDIANDWGFWHMGQFARDYRRMFGKLPSETLAASG
jgi:AraC-like DNA-binding protein